MLGANGTQRGPPWLESCAVDRRVRHLKGAPRVGSYSVVQCLRRLVGQPLCCSAANAGVWGERGYGDGAAPLHHPPCLTQQERLASMAAWLSSTGISQQSPPSHPLKLPLPVNSGPHPGVAAQSLNSSSQLLCLASPNQRHDSSEANLKKGPKWKVAQFLELSTSSTK